MEDRVQGAIIALQHTQEIIVQEEETGSDHKSEVCIGCDSIPLLSNIVTAWCNHHCTSDNSVE